MAFDLQSARKEGTDIEIVDYLSTKFPKFDLAGARKTGSNTEIAEYLTGKLSTVKPSIPQIKIPAKQGLLGKLGERATTIGEEITREPTLMDIGVSQRKGVRIAGQLAGGIGDVVGSAVAGIYKGVMPESWQKAIKSGIASTLDTEVGQIGLKALQGGTEKYQAFKSQFPDEAKDLEAVFNIGSIIPLGKVGGIAGKETIGITKDIARLRRTSRGLDNQLMKTVKSNMPAIVKKGNIKGSIDLFDKQSTRGVTSIIKNKDKLKYIDADGNIYKQGIPKTAEEALSAIEQNKREIFKQYSAAQTLSQKSIPSLSTKPIIQGLEKLKKKSFIQRDNAILKSIDDNIEFFKQKGIMALKEMDEEIANINAKTMAFQRNPNPNLINNQAVDVLIADRMRKSLGDTIESITDVGYFELKKDYGAMKVMERGFLDAVKRNRIKIPGGAADLSDVLTGGTAIYAWSNLNAPLIAATLGAKSIKSFHKWRIGADRLTKKMFREADTLIDKKEALDLPFKSKFFKSLKRDKPFEPEALQPTLGIEGRTPKLLTGREFELKGSPIDFTLQGKPRFTIANRRELPPGKMKLLTQESGYGGIKKTTGQATPGKVTSVKALTGDPFIDEKINIALRTPPSLRDAEQKFIIDLMTSK